MITWRKYRQSDIYYKDLDAVVALHLETEEAIGRKMQLPDLMSKPVLVAYVAEENGVVKGGFYCEAIVEVCFFGRDPRVTASARRQAAVAIANMRDLGFKMVRIECPRWIGRDVESIANELEAVGFVCTDNDFTHYGFDLTRGA